MTDYSGSMTDRLLKGKVMQSAGLKLLSCLWRGIHFLPLAFPPEQDQAVCNPSFVSRHLAFHGIGKV